MPAEALELRLVAAPVVSLAFLGTAPGVVISEAAGLNGPGVGRLRVTGQTVAWKAPHSGAFGVAVDVPTDGTYVLRDGEDPDKWLRITVYTTYLGDVTRNVYLEEVFGNVLVTDFNAATVAAGTVHTLTLRIYNVGAIPMEDVRVWLSLPEPEVPILGLAGSFRMDSSRPRRGPGSYGRAAISGISTRAAGMATLQPPPGLERSRRGGAAARSFAMSLSPFPPRTSYSVSISSDNVSFYTPREEFDPTTLVYGALVAGAFHTLYVRRTIPAGMAADPRGRTDLRTSFSSLY